MKERWKGKESQEAKRKERSRERGKLVIMEYVSRIVSVRYWQPYSLAPLKMYWPPFGLDPHSKKLAPPLSAGATLSCSKRMFVQSLKVITVGTVVHILY